MDKKIINVKDALNLLNKISDEIAVIGDTDDLHPKLQFYTLAEKTTNTFLNPRAAIINLIGSIVDISEYARLVLEYVIRQISGKYDDNSWKGLDKILDYNNLSPHSPIHNIRYLLQRYNNFINSEYFAEAYLYASIGSLILNYDEERSSQIKESLSNFGLHEIFNDEKFIEFVKKKKFDRTNSHLIKNYFVYKYGSKLRLSSYNDSVSATFDIYRFHFLEILRAIDNNNKEKKYPKELIEKAKKGIIVNDQFAIFFAIQKGWLGEDVKYFAESLTLSYNSLPIFGKKNFHVENVCSSILKASKYFSENPINIAILSPLRFCESKILLKIISIESQEQIKQLSAPEKVKKKIIDLLSNIESSIDILTTKSSLYDIGSNFLPDLYKLTVNKLSSKGISTSEIYGIDSSISGIIGLRSSGVGLAVLDSTAPVSNEEKQYPAIIASAGLLDIIIQYNFFVQ